MRYCKLSIYVTQVVCVSLLVFAGCSAQTALLADELSKIDSMPPNPRLLKGPDHIPSSWEACIVPIKKSEFDTLESNLARSKSAPCTFVGVSAIKGKGDDLNGDVLSYDPQHETIRLLFPLKRDGNLLHGLEGATPYDIDFRKSEAQKLTPDQKKSVKTAGKSDFLLIALATAGDSVGSYAASNAYGAKTNVVQMRGVHYDIAINIGAQSVFIEKPLELMSAQVDRVRAEELMPFLDVRLYWMASIPCELCFPGGQVIHGEMTGPTFLRPLDIKITHNFVFARLVGIKLVDRRTGEVVKTFSGIAQ